MTTKVIVTCPDRSHWAIKVSIEDRAFSFETQKYNDEWEVTNSVVLQPTESHETYIHGSRRLTVEEISRS
jgi:hypothetical protein